MNYIVRSPKKHTVNIDRKADTGRPFEVVVDKNKYTVAIRRLNGDGRIQTLMIDHRVCPVEVERRGDGLPVRVFFKGVPYEVEISRMASTRFRPPLPEPEISGAVRASLPGQIVRILVKPGETVSRGDPLFVLDAMKMENEIASPKEGTVQSIAVRIGQVVAKGDLVLEIGG